ncbi:MAG: U32 family peptidase [Clostridia bacterium]|nr:U32 family peptidase [Clostridia bacterium]
MRGVELLAPAGDMDTLVAAERFGADAVYIGGPQMQLRAASVGFTIEGVARAAAHLHSRGKRLYVTVNAFADQREADAAGAYGRALLECGADAVIVSDLGVIARLRAEVPELEIHVSTQANCQNADTARVYAQMGCRRVVLGREMALEDIRQAHARLGEQIELEVFVHGAMCMAYSGRCMISASLTDRSANRGACAQSCRWRYHLMEEKRPGQFFPVEEDDRGMTILSSLDLNAMPFLDQVLESGVRSLKIEGRMKTPYYVATVVNAYRQRIDAILNGTDSPDLIRALQRELNAVSHRPYSSGFYFGQLRKHAADEGVYLQDCRFVGVVRQPQANGWILVELRNKFAVGDTLELVFPGTRGACFAVDALYDEDGGEVYEARVPQKLYALRCPYPVVPGDMLRMRIEK